MPVTYEQRGLISVITINRPETLNVLNGAVMRALSEILDKISANNTRCLIVTGAGDKSFAAGADVGEMLPLNEEQARTLSEKGNAVFRKLERLSIPSIAAVNGFALGGGCELAMACDIRLAGENAQFSQPEVTLGITAGYGGTQRLPRLIGLGMAKELLYSGLRIGAAEALRIGLVNHVYSQESLMDEALKLAQRIAGAAPAAVSATKEAIEEGYGRDIDEAIAREVSHFSSCFTTEDQKKAMVAFTEKRKPGPFIGR